MNPRRERGRLIADNFTITRKGNVWEVPSQTGTDKRYLVSIDRKFCTCPDHTETGVECKHQHAVLFSIANSERLPNQSGVPEKVDIATVTKLKKKSYPQKWPQYHAAQKNERRHFLAMLADLCRTLPIPAPKPGRPPLRPDDAAYACVLKVYGLMSARRATGDLEEAYDKGYVSTIPHYNSVIKSFDSEWMTTVLTGFIEQSAAPLKVLEKDFAVDSTGFSSTRYSRWFDHKYGKPCKEAHWVKTHAMVGVKTNVITSVTIVGEHTHDSTQLPGLVESTAKRFTIREVSGDAAYAASSNFKAVDDAGGVFYPAFRGNTKALTVNNLFSKAFHQFKLNEEEYQSHYHKRSNVESTFSAVKRKFGEAVRSKTDTAMKNEVLAKIVCFNITCLIHEMYELGIDPSFGADLTRCPQTQEVASILRFPG
ncbi:MAG TPA: transposase [Fimbriiglobus sp.]